MLTSSASSPVSCSVSHPVSPPLLFPSLLHFIIFIVLLSCNREVPSRPSEAPVEVLSTRALTGATAVPPYPMPCCALHAWQGQDTLRQQGLSKAPKRSRPLMRTLSSSQGSHVTPHQGLIKLGWARDTARPPHSNYGPLALSFPILLFQSSTLPLGLLPMLLKETEAIFPRQQLDGL